MDEDISVLLYEPTRSGEVSLSCVWWCEIQVDDLLIANAQTIIIRQEWESIVWFIDMVRYEANQISVYDKDEWAVQITSYDNYSGNNPLNIYNWKLILTIQQWRDLELWMREWFTVVNQLPFKDYLRGMWESSEAQHFEKTKALAYLTKTYALFYRTWNNPHPSIPLWVNYTAIDDPRSFQRYLWAGIETSSPLWLQAVDATYDTLVLYDEYIPILPYYHCSAWFSWSWEEKFGRSDTPWLVSKKDIVTCESWWFEGHGVWMSGDGAEYLAQAWASAQEILQYWYQSVYFEKK
jgi:peptidoglycan hydrolase-like amidase